MALCDGRPLTVRIAYLTRQSIPDSVESELRRINIASRRDNIRYQLIGIVVADTNDIADGMRRAIAAARGVVIADLDLQELCVAAAIPAAANVAILDSRGIAAGPAPERCRANVIRLPAGSGLGPLTAIARAIERSGSREAPFVAAQLRSAESVRSCGRAARAADSPHVMNYLWAGRRAACR